MSKRKLSSPTRLRLTRHQCSNIVVALELLIDKRIQQGTESSLKAARQLGRTMLLVRAERDRLDVPFTGKAL